MIDPFTIIDLYIKGQEFGKLLSDWVYGKNFQHLQAGVEYISNGIEHYDYESLEKAISELDHVNENDDRLFVLAYSYLYRAICYTYLFKFSLAYLYLDKLESIDYKNFTCKKDTIKETKREGCSFRNEVVKLEKIYKSQKNRKICKKAFIILSCIVIVGALIALFFTFF